MSQRKDIVPLFLLLLVHCVAFSQVLPVGTPGLEDKYRRDQLLGIVDSSISFTIRPLTAAALSQTNVFNPTEQSKLSAYIYGLPDDDLAVQLLPVRLQYQQNGSYPYGGNDGPLIPSKGGQVLLTGGIFAKYKFITLQLQPELMTARGAFYDGMGNLRGYGLEWYRAVGNKIDMPEYFGRGGYSGAYLGQSSLRFNFNAVSFGVSTENLWWGPGRENTLLLSNTAPGFLHFTVNTTKPVKTPIGSFEGQLVGGRLKQSGFPPSRDEDLQHFEKYYVEKPEDDRYFSGLIVSYQPKWIPGLSLGYISTFISYMDYMSGINDYLPFLHSSDKTITYLDDFGKERTTHTSRDRYQSAFFRWVMPAGKMEIYGEYGRNNSAGNFRDLMVRPNQSRAYVLGFRKLVPLSFSPGDYFQFAFETTELSVPPSHFLRNSQTWYMHPIIRDGYTHRGQLLGAGIGPGGSVQNFEVSWVRDIKQVGLKVERLVHNEDFFYTYVYDLRRSWTDLTFMGYAHWDHNNFLFQTSIGYSYAHNYRYEFSQPVPQNDFWKFGREDRDNFIIQLGASYRF